MGKQIVRRGVPGPSRSLGNRDPSTSGGASWANDAALALTAADRTLDEVRHARALTLCHLLADLRNPPELDHPCNIISHETVDEGEDSPHMAAPAIAAHFGDELAMFVEEIVTDYASTRFKYHLGRDKLTREELYRLILREICGGRHRAGALGASVLVPVSLFSY